MDKFVNIHTATELNNHIYRLINQLSQYPKIVKYIDTYLNDMFYKFEFRSMVYTLHIIAHANGILTPGALKYSRYKRIDRDLVYNAFRAYYRYINHDFNERDLFCMHLLYTCGSVTPQHIAYMKDIISDKVDRSKTNVLVAEIQPQKKTRVDNIEIVKYKNTILEYVKNRAACGDCPLRKDGYLVTTTNMKEPGPVNVLFISDGPSQDEMISQEHGLIATDNLVQMCEDNKLKYAFINLTLCNISNATTAPKVKKAIASCESIFNELRKMFNPNIEVIVGDNARTRFGIRGGKSIKLNGEIYRNTIVAAEYDKLEGKHLIKFLNGFATLIADTSFKKQVEIDVSSIKGQIKSKLVEVITPDLILFDIKEVDDQVLYIFTNTKGEKVYYLEPMVVDIYIKPGDMIDCNYIEPKAGVDRCRLNSKQLKQLKYTLYRR